MPPEPHASPRRGGRPRSRLRAWYRRWGAILPLLAAEFVVWVGFGGLLPVMPLYFIEHGVDLATLGLVVAAWPAARLIGEPAFGWLADRVARVPLMVVGLVLCGIFLALPLLWTGPLAFLILRALNGLSTAIYDPAARGYITDATPPARRGEAFGLYGAAQMAGLLLGPAIGGIGASLFGGIAFVFIFSAVASFAAAALIALRVRESAQVGRQPGVPSIDVTEFPADSAQVRGRAATDALDDATAPTGGVLAAVPRPSTLWNRLLVAALIVNFGGNFAAGTYEVVWSLFLQGLGAGLDLIGLTFAAFGLPILLLSPYFGRRVDRGGVLGFIVAGSLLPAIAGILYTQIQDPFLAVPIILLEAAGFAMLNPALYAVVAAGSPVGRSSTAQGIYGASGTIGFIVASLVTGWLAAETTIVAPFFVFTAIMLASLALALLIGGRSLAGSNRAPEPAVA
jgi:MFS family permease